MAQEIQDWANQNNTPVQQNPYTDDRSLRFNIRFDETGKLNELARAFAAVRNTWRKYGDLYKSFYHVGRRTAASLKKLASNLDRFRKLKEKDDKASTGNFLQINTTTGEYQFANCGKLAVGGSGLISRRGGVLNLQHNAMDHRVLAKLDTATNKATASIQLLSTGQMFSISDRDITNNTCACK